MSMMVGQKKILNNRQRRIVEQLMIDGIIKVEDTSASLGVSPITIRRDLDFLQRQGLLERIHGGALPLKNQQLELPYIKREQLQIEEKIAIGKKTAELIHDRSIIFVSSGSTALEVLRHLLYKNVQVITNNVDSIHLFSRSNPTPSMDLIIIGGQYRNQSHSLSGDMALESISNIYSSYTILGVNGIHPTYGVTISWNQHVSLHKKMLKNCKGKIIVVADSSKIDVISNFFCANAGLIDILVTDRGIQKDSVQNFEDLGVQVLLA